MSTEHMPVFERLIGYPLLKLHDRIYKATGGRIGHRIPFTAPILMLHTVGAKTGADYGEKSAERLAQRNGYRDRWTHASAADARR